LFEHHQNKLMFLLFVHNPEKRTKTIDIEIDETIHTGYSFSSIGYRNKSHPG
jgi:hypothetical protein